MEPYRYEIQYSIKERIAYVCFSLAVIAVCITGIVWVATTLANSTVFR
jgi:hypothetical protein